MHPTDGANTAVGSGNRDDPGRAVIDAGGEHRCDLWRMARASAPV